MVKQGVCMGKDYVVIDCIEHPERNRCIDIIRQHDGKYRFQEWRRDSEDTAGWILVFDSTPTSFDSERAAIGSARKMIAWLQGAQKTHVFYPAG